MGATGTTTVSKFKIPDNQKRIENSIRDDDKETIYWMDENGNTLVKATGDKDHVDYIDDDAEFNHKVEQLIWNGGTVHVTHNHPEATIFSPEDIDAMVSLENKSEAAVLPKGSEFSAFRLVRQQPISSNTYIMNSLTGELEKEQYWTSKYEPTEFTNAYSKAYDKVYTPIESQWNKLDKDYKYGKIDKATYQKEIQPLLKTLNSNMIKWLDKNAKDYGFQFIKEK